MIVWEKCSPTQWQGKLGPLEINLYEDGFLWSCDFPDCNFISASIFREISDKLEALQFETNLSLGRVLREMDQCSPGVQGIEPNSDPEITAYPGPV